ncbi:MAG: hypothetical protein ACOCVV_11310, partial [Marinobacter sp.]
QSKIITEGGGRQSLNRAIEALLANITTDPAPGTGRKGLLSLSKTQTARMHKKSRFPARTDRRNRQR